MRVPMDVPLSDWVSQLERDGRLYRFYKTKEWRALRDEVMSDHHWECEACRRRGVYRRADTVHHEHEVRKRPWMALTRYEGEGDARRELWKGCLMRYRSERRRRGWP